MCRLFAKEAGLNLLLGGHYRTEAPGIRDLTERTAAHFGLDWRFIDDDPTGEQPGGACRSRRAREPKPPGPGLVSEQRPGPM